MHRGILGRCTALSLSMAVLLPLGAATPAIGQETEAAPPPSLATACKGKRSVKGGILGGLIGAGVGLATTGKAEGALGGAVLGGGAGFLLGKSWDKKACAESQKAVALAMRTGQTQRWRSEDGTKAYTLAVDRRYVGQSAIDRNIPMLEGRTLVTTGLVEAGGVYQVGAQQVNLRDRPDVSKKSKVLDTARTGDRLLALGQTPTGDWLLLSSRGIAAEGWAKASSLRLTQDDPAAFARSDTRPTRATRIAMRPTCIETREVFELKGKVSSGPKTEQCRDDSGVFVSREEASDKDDG